MNDLITYVKLDEIGGNFLTLSHSEACFLMMQLLECHSERFSVGRYVTEIINEFQMR